MSGELPLSVSRETHERLRLYAELVEKWNPSINLVGKGEDIWSRHIADSVQLLSLLPTLDITLADFGSGGGFPGLALAILGVREVHLVESDQRKMIFLKEAARVTSVAPVFHVKRIEDISLPPCDVITARALASLTTLCTFASPHMHASTFCLFPKGRNYSIEIDEARREWDFDVDIKPSLTAADAVILSIRNLMRK